MHLKFKTNTKCLHGIQSKIYNNTFEAFYDSIFKFTKGGPELNHPRDDYTELLELTVLFLGVKLLNGNYFKTSELI